MTLFDTGRICVKTAGREAGRLCIVLDKVDNDHVMVTGPRAFSGIRKRKCNVAHLEPLQAKLKIKSEAADSEILDLLKKEDELLLKFKLRVPTAEEIKKSEARRAEKQAAKTATEAKKAGNKRDDADSGQRQPSEKPKKEKAVTISELATEKTKIAVSEKKENKGPTISELAAENRKLIEKKEARKKDEKK